jgi:hypothetical protein
MNAHRIIKSSLFALSVLALCACNPAPTADQLGQDEQAAVDEATGAAAPRLYDPMSKTAEAFTGTLEFTDEPRPGPNATPRMKIIAGMNHVWEISFVESVKAGDAVGGQQWIAFLPAAVDAQVNVYSVESETIDSGAVNGGLCAPQATSFMAFTEAQDEAGDTKMTMAAFKDKTWPPQEGQSAQLCGTFTYTLNKADAQSGTP